MSFGSQHSHLNSNNSQNYISPVFTSSQNSPNFDAGTQCSQNTQLSQNSSYYDDLFDLNKPNSFDSISVPKLSKPTQLFLTRNAHSSSEFESGFDLSSNQIENRTISFQPAMTPIPSVFLESNYTQTSSEFQGSSQIQCNESYDSNDTEMPLSGQATEPSDGSQYQSNNDSIDTDMPLSGTAAAIPGDEPRSPIMDEPDIILPDIYPVLKLYDQIRKKYSESAFVHALANNMCKKLYPKNSYTTLKTALLLSIVSCDVRIDSQPISIMAVTRDSLIASDIMRHIGEFAKNFICISDFFQLNNKNAATNPLLVARDGVCYVGDWLGLKPASLSYLQNVLDGGRVVAQSKVGFPDEIYALKCAVWMYWSCSAQKMRQNEKDLSTISKLFGIPVVLDDSPSEEVIDFILAKHSVNPIKAQYDEDEEIDEQTIATYLQFVSEIETEFEAEALALLNLYFVITRSIRPNILTPKSYDILRRLSECHAKLCMRKEVQKIDVVFVIDMFEQYVLKMFAGQVMTKPIPNESPSSFQQVDDNMREFADWLDGYLLTITENVHTFFQENV